MIKTSRRTFLQRTTALAPFFFFTSAKSVSAQDRPPVILILGDSISIGYTPFLTEKLQGRAEVRRPQENCQGSTRGVERIDAWLGEVRWDVIHFNFGLHDIKHVHPVTGENSSDFNHPLQADLETYKKNLAYIIERIKRTDAKLIFATTTPVPENTAWREAGAEVPYNKAAVQLAQSHNIIINDLHAFCLPILSEIQLPANVHFRPEGYKRLAEKVAEAILREWPCPLPPETGIKDLQ
ncbi:MAG TPA: SGNH/GDSL hydrolase family protein [bacterium]|nr:SGNH/GDSL hydrolase family protein [bacterium]HPN35633.1 SGNH/GDSL hydrolase family protein [bacterium]